MTHWKSLNRHDGEKVKACLHFQRSLVQESRKRKNEKCRECDFLQNRFPAPPPPSSPHNCSLSFSLRYEWCCIGDLILKEASCLLYAWIIAGRARESDIPISILFEFSELLTFKPEEFRMTVTVWLESLYSFIGWLH